MAARLFLAEGTVRNYLSSAMAKLRARNRTEEAGTAQTRGRLWSSCGRNPETAVTAPAARRLRAAAPGK
ncbi:response regulator transcription factor [Amycolatopsis acidiphila]|uniref:Response regulator transcription factor n=1 Tax=Amycolatopsis acidiphila TaxID=715473 RepID=A0A558APD9_9PSEU|nr:response regulator transcription factor [Amycolatopsis acidiphila]